MTIWLGGCTSARTVTLVAVTGSTGIMNPATTFESCSGMTGGTVQAGRNMSRYGIDHTLRRSAIITGCTIVGDAGMIEGRRFEGIGRITDTAILIGRDMSDFFRCCKTGIVTGCTVIHDAHMIKARR